MRTYSTLVSAMVLASTMAAQDQPKAADAKAAETFKLPDGVIYVKLPGGDLRMESLVNGGKPVLRVSVGKTVIETRTMFLGDRKRATVREASKGGVHWVSTKGAKAVNLGAAVIHAAGSTIDEVDALGPDQIRSGNIYVTTPSLMFRWGKDAIPLQVPQNPKVPDPKSAAALKLPEGVIHVAFAPGKLRMEKFVSNGKPLIRLTQDETVIEARAIFFGDAKGATHYEAIDDGIHWAPASGGRGFVSDGVKFIAPGNTIGDPDFHPLEKLKAGSVFITTPSIRFLFGAEAKP